MAHMIAIYRKPANTEAFDEHYFGTHVPLAKKLPGLRKYEVSRAPVIAAGAQSDVYLIATLYFDDLAAIRAAFASEAGQACSADRKLFAPDQSMFQMYLFDTKEV